MNQEIPLWLIQTIVYVILKRFRKEKEELVEYGKKLMEDLGSQIQSLKKELENLR